ncbi:MAG: Fic family protein [Gemmatimonadetes bacterium]|nr:Fic family protein [Gemmatimonadota bacterium]
MSNALRRPIGQAWLVQNLELAVPRPAVESYAVAGARRTRSDGSHIVELYPMRYAPDETVTDHMRFALRHEAFDLGVLVAALHRTEPAVIERWVREQPTGIFSRRTWFLYETFTGRTLDLEDARMGNYVALLDSEHHVVAEHRKSRRHRVADNLLGGPGICPTVRLTPKLLESMNSGLEEEARTLTETCDPAILERAVNYLYTKETRSSFALEGETPDTRRTRRFVAALRAAPDFDPSDKAALLRLHAAIVDPRYAEDDWRHVQNFVGETIGGYREQVPFVCPRPTDVPALMDAWTRLTRRVTHERVDPVVAAAVSAFAFVFIHPFADGNGRIHRFLVHHVLAKCDYGPPGAILPISAAILRDQRGYDRVLASYSEPLLDFIQWHWAGGMEGFPGREMVVCNETAHLYRYFDATAFAEYLYDRVAESIRQDLKEEIDFVAVFDRALEGVREIVNMPDRRASLLVRLCMRNGGRLAARKRPRFPELSDEEIAGMEAAVGDALGATRGLSTGG